METFYLMDGAMAYSTLGASRHFTDRQATWFAPLMPLADLRLAGALLLAPRTFSKDPAIEADTLRAVSGFPHRLHLSVIDSELTFESLADHLRAFVYFSDNEGQPYGLRIADCRVLAYLPGVLTQGQWDALTAPMARWQVHDRTGRMTALALNETRRECIGTREAIGLNDEQIERLIHAGEPDALLGWLDLEPENVALNSVKWHHDVARHCVELWRQSGSSNRGVLLTFARRVFASDGAWLKDSDRVEKELRSAAASVTASGTVKSRHEERTRP